MLTNLLNHFPVNCIGIFSKFKTPFKMELIFIEYMANSLSNKTGPESKNLKPSLTHWSRIKYYKKLIC